MTTYMITYSVNDMLPIIMQLGSFLSPKVSEFGSTAPPFIAGGGGEERWNTLFATKRERKCYLHFIPNRKGLNFTQGGRTW